MSEVNCPGVNCRESNVRSQLSGVNCPWVNFSESNVLESNVGQLILLLWPHGDFISSPNQRGFCLGIGLSFDYYLANAFFPPKKPTTSQLPSTSAMSPPKLLGVSEKWRLLATWLFLIFSCGEKFLAIFNIFWSFLILETFFGHFFTFWLFLTFLAISEKLLLVTLHPCLYYNQVT